MSDYPELIEWKFRVTNKKGKVIRNYYEFFEKHPGCNIRIQAVRD